MCFCLFVFIFCQLCCRVLRSSCHLVLNNKICTYCFFFWRNPICRTKRYSQVYRGQFELVKNAKTMFMVCQGYDKIWNLVTKPWYKRRCNNTFALISNNAWHDSTMVHVSPLIPIVCHQFQIFSRTLGINCDVLVQTIMG